MVSTGLNTCTMLVSLFKIFIIWFLHSSLKVETSGGQGIMYTDPSIFPNQAYYETSKDVTSTSGIQKIPVSSTTLSVIHNRQDVDEFLALSC